MVEKYLQEAFSKLSEILPSGWKKINLHAVIESGFYDIFFYVKVGNEYIQCYDLENRYQVTEDEIDYALEEWYKVAISAKNDETWKDYTVVIGSNGKFTVDYNYDEEFDLFVWKEKYLKG